MTLRTSELILPKFHGIWNSKSLFKVLKGGRSSGKSTTVGFKVPLEIIKHKVDALVVRKVGNTLKDSVYAQIMDAIERLGLSNKFRGTTSPLEIKYLPTGQRIIFRGADKPERVKSIKSKFPIGIVWFEEPTEFKTFEEVETIIDSVVRAEGYYSVYFTYNPPKRKRNWCNLKWETQFVDSNTTVHHSTSFDNTYQGKDFLERAALWKVKDPKYWEWNYLGKPIGGGIVPFSNLEFRRIADEEIAAFDNIKQGLDWGFSVDPLAFSRLHYDKKARGLYIFGEIYEIKVHNALLSRRVKTSGWNDTMIIADSAEPKSISDLCSYGLKTFGAKKGPGSIEYGLEWLDSLEFIIIDPYRCPNGAKEFENADYEVDRDGNTIPKLSGADHFIDAVRYATEDIQQNRDDFYPTTQPTRKWRYGV
jgi:PBSX family phage terminase large subunit